MADLIVKLAQPGFDARTAGDENLIFSSKWPLLKIYKTGRAFITETAEIQVLGNHNLGFTPLFWWYSCNRLEDWVNFGTPEDNLPAERSEYQGVSFGGTVYADKDKIFYFSPGGVFGLTGRIEIFYYIFALDLNADYIAPRISVGSQPQGGSGKTTFKVAKPGANTESTSLEDYAIHSDTRSPLLHSIQSAKIGPDPTHSFSAVVTHNLGYVPLFFGFRKGPLEFPASHKSLFSSSGNSGFIADEKTIRFIDTTDTGRTYTVVTLKDPFDVANVIDVSI